MRICRPRIELAKAAARETLNCLGITYPPASGEILVRSLARVKLVDDDEEEEDAITTWHPRRGYIVFVRETILDGRRNWNFSHEGGHICLKHLEQFDPDRLTDRELAILDREANVFAREFLMPQEWVKKYVPIPCGVQALGAMKELFGVSWDALIWRLHELGMQPYEITRRFLRERQAAIELWESFMQSLTGA